jgi:RNA polymerase sigma factor (sigma-70 family)
MPITRNRDQELGQFFVRYAAQLRRSIAGNVTAPTAVIEDACAFAWLQLARYPHVELTHRGYSWLYRVALREAWRLAREERRGSLTDEKSEAAYFEAPGAADVAQDAEHRELLALTKQLPERKRRILLLHALGYHYDEIAHLTGDTVRTVDRQRARAKELLRRAVREYEQGESGRDLPRRERASHRP